MNRKSNVYEIVQIAIGVGTIIVGGYGILVFSSPFAIPGMKYIMMAPYLSLVMTVLRSRLSGKYVLLKANAVFAMIMSFINLYMGIAIFLSGVLTQILQLVLWKRNKWTTVLVCSGYSSFVLLTALPISKYLIGGVAFERISDKWILISAGIAFVIGCIGSLTGVFISKRISNIKT